MHVLVTADTVGGVWTYTRELVGGLSQRGVRVTLVSFGEIPGPAQAQWLDHLRGVDYRATAFRLEWMRDCIEDLRASSEFLQQVIFEVQPDVLHFSQYHYGTLEVAIPKVVVAHSDVLSWWETVHGELPAANLWLAQYQDIVAQGLAGANVVVAPSRWMLATLERHYGTVPNGMVIYNGRNPGLFNPHVSKEDLVVAVGRVWDKGKNLSLLLQGPHNLPVWIAGAEEHPEHAVRGQSTVPACARGVRFLGPQSEAQLCQLFSRASIYAVTSQYEPFGLAPVEAAFSRCAIVANDIASLRELWGETACYFRYNDADDLARAIHRLQQDRELRLTYSNLAYRRAQQRFTAERMVSDYMTLYQTLASAGAAAA
jgi:glycosyltransferase involved in cell wall biosynthesis